MAWQQWRSRRRSILAAAAAAAAVLLVGTTTPAAAAYFTEAEWLAALPTGATPEAMPAQTATAQDALATYQQGVPQTVTAWTSATQTTAVTMDVVWNQDTSVGQWSGFFWCDSRVWPCLGASRITYTFPFPIIGLAGWAQFATRDPFPNGSFDFSFFDVTASDFGGPDSGAPFRQSSISPLYTGFYGDLFAPTTSITVEWRTGLANQDFMASFVLRPAMVIAAPFPVPEPPMPALLLSAMMLLGAIATQQRRLRPHHAGGWRTRHCTMSAPHAASDTPPAVSS